MSARRLQAIQELRGDRATAAEILDAIRRADGNRRKAAALLHVSSKTLYRRIAELALWPKIDQLCTRHRLPIRKGRARK
jgi:DNA-binding NtrC family response regulator